MSTIKDFSGGLNIRPHPQLIAPNNSTEYINCENEEGILKPTLGPLVSTIASNKRWVHFRECDTVISSDEEAYWAELDGYMYESTDDGIVKIDCEGNRVDLGIEGPEDAPTLSDGGVGELCGVYKYVYTYYNADEGIESKPTPLSGEYNIEEVDTTPPPDPVDPQLDEKQEFVLLGDHFDTIRNTHTGDADAQVEGFKCALDHAYDFTIPEFITYVDEQYAFYNDGALNNTDKAAQMTWLYYGTPAAHDVKRSYYNMCLRVQANLDSLDSSNAQADNIWAILNGEPIGVEEYGPEYHQLVLDMIVIRDSPPPTGYPSPTADWYIVNYNCILFGMDLIEAEEVEIIDPTCGGAILVSGIVASPDPQVTNIRLYRIGGVLTQYNLVAELPNTNQTYLDTASDDTIAGNHVLDSFTNGTPPDNPLYLTESNAMLFVASGTKLYFSDVAKPYAWPETNFLEFSVEITGMGVVQNGLMVFTRFRTYIVTGTNPATLARFLTSDSQGCVNHDTIAFGDNLLVWLSTDGVCTSAGGAVEVVTQTLLGRFSPETSLNGWVWDKMYFLGYEDKTLILDSRYGYAIRELDYNGWYSSFHDELYRQNNGFLEQMFVGAIQTMKYKSPIYTEGRLSEYKMFKDIYVTFQDYISMKVIIHGHKAPYQHVVFDEILDIEEMQRDIKTDGTIMGYGISFEIEGTGQVHEIDFRASGRENGK